MRATVAVLLFTALLMTSAGTANAQEQKKQSKIVESQRITTENPEVAKLKEGLNDKSNKTQNDPPKQHGPIYGDNYCDVVVDNYTNLYIKVWVDDQYRGVLAPYGKMTVAALPGKTKLYARADYTDGSYAYWNPPSFDCSWEYTWRLR